MIIFLEQRKHQRKSSEPIPGLSFTVKNAKVLLTPLGLLPDRKF